MKNITNRFAVYVNGALCRLPLEIIFDHEKAYKMICYGKVKCYKDNNTWDYVEGHITFAISLEDQFPDYNPGNEIHR